MKKPRRRIQKARRKAEKRAAAERDRSRRNLRFMHRLQADRWPRCEIAFCSATAQYRVGDASLCCFHAER